MCSPEGMRLTPGSIRTLLTEGFPNRWRQFVGAAQKKTHLPDLLIGQFCLKRRHRAKPDSVLHYPVSRANGIVGHAFARWKHLRHVRVKPLRDGGRWLTEPAVTRGAVLLIDMSAGEKVGLVRRK